MSDSLIHALSGALGGVASMAITYPLTSISTRAQVERSRSNDSLIKAVRKAIEKDGVASLFDGLSSSIFAIAVTNAVYYGAFEQCRFTISEFKRKRGTISVNLSTLESMLASSVAGAMTTIAVNPFWVVNTRQTVRRSVDADLEANNGPSSGTTKVATRKMGFVETVLHIYNNEGLAGFFRGIGPALILVINPVLQYTLFEQLKNAVVARRTAAAQLPSAVAKAPTGPNSNAVTSKPTILPLTDLDYFWLGAVSKLFATGTTYPYLTVKSRQQANREGAVKYKSAWDGLTRIVKEEGGVSALYRGAPAKLTQSMLTAAFLFLSKERFYLLAKALILRRQALAAKGMH